MQTSDGNISLDRAIVLGDGQDTEWLSRFGRALVRHRWVILGIVLLAAALSAGISWLTPPPYKAESWLLIRFPNTRAADVDAMSSLISNYTLEERVLANPRIQQLPEAIRRPGTLAGFIDIAGNGDTRVIKITASQPKPADAALLADVWAQESITFLNDHYLDSVERLTSLRDASKAQYEQAQQAYVNHVRTSNLDQLTAQAAALTQALQNYLTDQYSARQKLQAAIASAQTLKSAVDSAPGVQPENSLALTNLVLTANSILPVGTPPLQLQVAATQSTPGGTKQDQLAQLDRLISVLQNRLKEVQSDIDQAAQSITDGKSTTTTGSQQSVIAQFLQRQQEVEAQLESAKATSKELADKRDSYYGIYTDLDKRIADVTNGTASLGRVEQIVQANADVAQRQGSRTSYVLRNATTALALSFIIAVVAVVLYELLAPGRLIVSEITGALVRRRRAPVAG